MTQFFSRFIFIIAISIFQFSYLNIVLHATVPYAVLFAAISWVLVLGFLVAIPWIVALGIIFDILSLNSVIGITALLITLFSYTASFTSKRFLFEHRGFGLFIMIIFTIVSSSIYEAITFALQEKSLSVLNIFLDFIGSFSYRLVFYETLLFLLIYFIVFKMEKMLRTRTMHISMNH